MSVGTDSPENPNRSVENSSESQICSQKQLWEFWEGNNRFLCKGKFMTGPKKDNYHLIFTVIVAVLLPSVYLLAISKYIWNHVSPWILIFTVYFHLVSIVLFLLTTLTEPGIIPRKKLLIALGNFTEEFSGTLMFEENNRNSKFCTTCEIYRPPLAHHCYSCDNCVEDFDHHCPYVNNCIGKRNYLFFIGMVVHFVFLGVMQLVGIGFYFFYDPGVDASDESVICQKSVVITIVVVIATVCLITTLLLSFLCLFHFSLIFSGRTTKQVVKKDKEKVKKSCWKRSYSRFDPSLVLSDQQLLVLQSPQVEVNLDTENCSEN